MIEWIYQSSVDWFRVTVFHFAGGRSLLFFQVVLQLFNSSASSFHFAYLLLFAIAIQYILAFRVQSNVNLAVFWVICWATYLFFLGHFLPSFCSPKQLYYFASQKSTKNLIQTIILGLFSPRRNGRIDLPIPCGMVSIGAIRHFPRRRIAPIFFSISP